MEFPGLLLFCNKPQYCYLVIAALFTIIAQALVNQTAEWMFCLDYPQSQAGILFYKW
jgi:hypothetical protein